jgi:hypothetical protein
VAFGLHPRIHRILIRTLSKLFILVNPVPLPSSREK